MNVTIVRTAVIGGTTLLGLGLAAPAMACIATQDAPGSLRAASFGTHDPSRDSDELSVADYQAKVDEKLARLEGKLIEKKARIADSTRLSDGQKADKTARIDELLATVAALRVQVAGETTIEGIKAAVHAAFAPDVEDVKARIDAKLASWIDRLDTWEAAVEADTSLDPEAKAAKLAKLQAWEDKVVALRAEIAAATTVQEAHAALKAAGLDPFGRMVHRHGHHGFGHDRSDRDGNASDHRTKHAGWDDVSVWGGDGKSHGPRHDRGDRSDRRGGDNHRFGSHHAGDRDGDRQGSGRGFGG